MWAFYLSTCTDMVFWLVYLTFLLSYYKNVFFLFSFRNLLYLILSFERAYNIYLYINTNITHEQIAQKAKTSRRFRVSNLKFPRPIFSSTARYPKFHIINGFPLFFFFFFTFGVRMRLEFSTQFHDEKIPYTEL